MDVDKPLASRIKFRQQELTDNLLDDLFHTADLPSVKATIEDHNSRRLSLTTPNCVSPDSRRSTFCLVPETPSPVFNRIPQKRSIKAHNSHPVSTSECRANDNSDPADSSSKSLYQRHTASSSGTAAPMNRAHSTSLFYKKLDASQAFEKSPNKVVLNKTGIHTSINSHPATTTAFPSRSNRNSGIKQTKTARTTIPEKYFLKPKSPVNGIFTLTPPSPRLLLSPKKQTSSCLFENYEESSTSPRESCAHSSSSATASMLRHSPEQLTKQKSPHSPIVHSKRSSVLKRDDLVSHTQFNTSRADALKRLKLARQKRSLASHHSDNSTIPAPRKDKQQRCNFSTNCISSDEEDDMSLQSFLGVTASSKNKSVDNIDGLLIKADNSINRRPSDNFNQIPSSLGTNNECEFSEANLIPNMIPKFNASALSGHPGPSKTKRHIHNGLVKTDHKHTVPRMRVSHSTPDITVLDAAAVQGACAHPSSHHTETPYLNLSPNHLMDDIIESISPGTDSAAHCRPSSSRNTSRTDSLYQYLSNHKSERVAQRNDKHSKHGKSNDSVIVVDLCTPDVATQKSVRHAKMPVRNVRDYTRHVYDDVSSSTSSLPDRQHQQQQQPMTNLTSCMGAKRSKSSPRSTSHSPIHAQSHESGMMNSKRSHKRRHAEDSDTSSRESSVTKRRKSIAGAALNSTMDATALVGQLESDEAMARRLQEELDHEFAMALSNESSVDHAHHPAKSPSALHYGSPCGFHPPEYHQPDEFHTPESHHHRGFHTPELHRTRSSTSRTRISPQRRHLTQDSRERFLREEGFLPEHMPQHFYGDVSTLPHAVLSPPDPWTLMHNHLEMLLNSQDPVYTAAARRQRRGQTRSPRRRQGMAGPHVAFFDIGSPFGDGNDYESLMNLAESLGDVKPKGLSKQQINCLPIKTYVKPEGVSGAECLICICDFENGDKLRILTCFHEFHATCIDKWLKSNGTCPVCRVEVQLT